MHATKQIFDFYPTLAIITPRGIATVISNELLLPLLFGEQTGNGTKALPWTRSWQRGTSSLRERVGSINSPYTPPFHTDPYPS